MTMNKSKFILKILITALAFFLVGCSSGPDVDKELEEIASPIVSTFTSTNQNQVTFQIPTITINGATTTPRKMCLCIEKDTLSVMGAYKVTHIHYE